jgi:hypothetical protein
MTRRPTRDNSECDRPGTWQRITPGFLQRISGETLPGLLVHGQSLPESVSHDADQSEHRDGNLAIVSQNQNATETGGIIPNHPVDGGH